MQSLVKYNTQIFNFPKHLNDIQDFQCGSACEVVN